MDKLLTIAIPTYNRAHLLDKQLAWLAQEIKGLKSACEVIISDNCSTDETPDVIKKWLPAFEGVVKVNRNGINLGVIRNIAFCIKEASSGHVWIISDDDSVEDNTISYVLDHLYDYPQLALLLLNFSLRDGNTGEVSYMRAFSIKNDTVTSEGIEVIEKCLIEREGAIALTTALIYRTDLAKKALERWPGGLDNLAVQMYITAFCAANGHVKVTKDTHLECTGGTHFWVNDNAVRIKLRYGDLPEVYAKFKELGYSRKLCMKRLMRKSDLKNLFFSFREHPSLALGILARRPLMILRCV